MIDLMLTWLLTYLLHSTLFLGTAWLLERVLRKPPWAEFMWRCALFGGLFTATLTPIFHSMLNTHWQLNGIVEMRRMAVMDDRPVNPESDKVLAVSNATTDERQPTPTALPIAQSLRLPDENLPIVVALGLAWALIAAGGLLRLGWQWLRLRGAIRRLPKCTDVRWKEVAAHVAQVQGMPAPQLLVSSQWDSPLLGPNHTVCVPQWCLKDLNAPQVAAVLAHEMAHAKRADGAWRLAMLGAVRIGWLQPLNAMAIRRLDALAERACDEAALRITQNRIALAEALFACARALRGGVQPTLALTMATAKTSPLLQRVQHLLKESPMTLNFGPRYLGWVALGLITASAFVLPAVVLDGRPLSAISWSDTFAMDDGPTMRVVTKWPEGRLEILARGQIEFAQDSDAVKKVDGRLMLEDFRGDQIQRISFTPDAQGGLQQRYFLNGREAPIDANALQWLQAHQSSIARTVLGTERYLQRVVTRGGFDAALKIVTAGDLQPDLVDALSRQGPMEDANVKRLLATIAVSTNDNAKSHALRAVAKYQILESPTKVRWLQVAAQIANDYERQQALSTFSPLIGADAKALQAWHLALRTMSNDFERHTAMLALLKDSTMDTTASMAMLASLETMQDAHEQTSVMLELVPKLAPRAEVLAQIERLARKLPTHERGQIEQALDGLREKLQSPGTV